MKKGADISNEKNRVLASAIDGLKWRVNNMFVTKADLTQMPEIGFDSLRGQNCCTALLCLASSVRLIRILRNDIRVSCSHTTVRLQPCMPALPKPPSIDQLT